MPAQPSLENPIGNGSPLRRWRHEQDLSLNEVSDLTGVSVATLSRVERGQRSLAPLTRVKVARRLGVAVRDLFEVETIEDDE